MKLVDPAIFTGLTVDELTKKLVYSLGARAHQDVLCVIEKYKNGNVLTEKEYTQVRTIKRGMVQKYPPIQTTRLQITKSGRILETNTYKSSSPLNPPSTRASLEMIYIQDRIRVLQGLIENERQKELNSPRNDKRKHGQ